MNEYAWRLLILCVFWWMAAVPDLKSKAIPVWIPIVFLLAAVTADLFLPTSIDKKILWSGAAPGGILLLLTLVSKRKIGEGDGLCLLTGGLIAGIGRILVILEGALVLVSLTGIFMIAAKRGRAEDRIAFLPFLAVSAGFAFLGELAG
jgi:leader peptidase (prepilin peptidase)/N-methyltransferase